MNITLSDGKECTVKVLGIFELDNIDPPRSRPFIYTIEIGGNKIERAYDVDAWDTPPEITSISPDTYKEGTVDYWSRFEYEMYWAAVYHEEENQRDIERYSYDVRDYILNNCISEIDKSRLITAVDYTAVYYAALVPQISFDDLSDALNKTFRASFNGTDVISKLFEGDEETGDGASYNAMRTWEIQAINASSLKETEWAELPLQERARRICAMKIDEWMAVLTSKKKEAEKKGMVM